MKSRLLLGVALLFWTVSIFAADTNIVKNSRTGPFILGAEVSWAPEDEADGAQYFDHGVRKDIFKILKEYKFNYIRLRLFVNPGATNGYATRRSEPFCDLAHVSTLAKRAKAAGMGLLLDIHYGDTWTSPGHHEKPGAWKNLSFHELTQAVHDFTHNAIYSMQTNGVAPDMVQVGNEISDGMLFPDGRRSNFDNFAALVKAGIAGVREVDPTIKIVLHHHLGRSNERMRPWIDNFVQRGTDFDIIGMSCYAQAQEGDWKNNFDDLARRYPDKGLLVVEYSAQKRYLNDLMFNTPDKKGLGTFIWEPTRHREALFDKNGANAGGGQASNFTTDEGIAQGARMRTNFISSTNLTTAAVNSANTPANTNSPEFIYRRFGTNETARAEWRQRRFGGRYDVNELLDLYPQMSKDYGNDKFDQTGGFH
jgi:arabinogalactan endo-1,4-beta-galactosidase